MNDRDFNDLDRVVPSLPAAWYFDPDHYARELRSVWYRQWIFLCRADAVAGPGSFATFTIGDQPILLVRDDAGVLRAFFNTCRHRGSILCERTSGQLGRKLITCRYHQWSYGLDGTLVRTPHWQPGGDFDPAQHGLFPVRLRTWCGFVFVNLAADAPALESALEPGAAVLDHWPLEDLVPVFQRTGTLACNWKVFWENFLECYHCPGAHPGLCDLVPLYRRTHMDARDAADWRAHEHEEDPAFRGGLRKGAETWSLDGLAHGPRFPGLSAGERDRGYTFLTAIPTMFVIAHVDYVRYVTVLPAGAERTIVTAVILMSPAQSAAAAGHLENITGFVTRLLDEDAAVCEINQKGLRALPFEQGVLVPQEYDVHAFHGWLKAQLA